MRRLLSIAMMLLFAFPLVAPALAQSARPGLLLCCRKGGMHHCTTPVSSDGPMLQSHCPVCCTSSAQGTAFSWMIDRSTHATVSASTEELKVRQVEAGYRISFHRSRQKRGPPAMRFS